MAEIYDGTITLMADLRCYGIGQGHRQQCFHHLRLYQQDQWSQSPDHRRKHLLSIAAGDKDDVMDTGCGSAPIVSRKAFD